MYKNVKSAMMYKRKADFQVAMRAKSVGIFDLHFVQKKLGCVPTSSFQDLGLYETECGQKKEGDGAPEGERKVN